MATILSDSFLAKYDLVDTVDKQYLINSFEQICFPDPFPNEKTFESKSLPPKENTDLVYDNVRMFKNKPPYVVYIPREEMMFKLMRACVNVS